MFGIIIPKFKQGKKISKFDFINFQILFGCILFGNIQLEEKDVKIILYSEIFKQSISSFYDLSWNGDKRVIPTNNINQIFNFLTYVGLKYPDILTVKDHVTSQIHNMQVSQNKLTRNNKTSIIYLNSKLRSFTENQSLSDIYFLILHLTGEKEYYGSH